MTPGTAFWILLSDPGAFIMERRMLKGLKARVERAGALAAPLMPGTTTPPTRSGSGASATCAAIGRAHRLARLCSRRRRRAARCSLADSAWASSSAWRARAI
jgi:hypothetical protein